MDQITSDKKRVNFFLRFQIFTFQCFLRFFGA